MSTNLGSRPPERPARASGGSVAAAPALAERGEKVVVVMPAFNAARTLQQTFGDIPEDYVAESLLVDDASQDDTVEVARSLGIEVIEHAENRGYGGNQKTCYKEALERGADIVIMLHPDYQYDPRLIPMMILPIRYGIFDIMLGSRVRSRRQVLKGGMPLYKYIGNRVLTLTENILLGQNLSEFHTGFRSYRREVLETLPFERFSNDFVFDSQFLISAIDAGFDIGEVPVPVRYMPEASSIDFRRSVRYGFATLATVGHYLRKRLHLGTYPIFTDSPRRTRPGNSSPDADST